MSIPEWASWLCGAGPLRGLPGAPMWTCARCSGMLLGGCLGLLLGPKQRKASFGLLCSFALLNLGQSMLEFDGPWLRWLLGIGFGLGVGAIARAGVESRTGSRLATTAGALLLASAISLAFGTWSGLIELAAYFLLAVGIALALAGTGGVSLASTDGPTDPQ